MSEEQNKPKKLSLSGSGKLSLGGNLEQAPLRGNAVVGSSRGKTVQVEVRRKRVGGTPIRGAQPAPAPVAAPVEKAVIAEPALADDRLTAAERANRIKVLQDGLSKSSEAAAGLVADKLLDDNATAAVVAEGEAENAVPEIPVVEEALLDPREARRRAELAELQEIEKQASAQRKVHSDKLTAENAARQAAAPQQRPKSFTNDDAPPSPREDTAPPRNRRRAAEWSCVHGFICRGPTGFSTRLHRSIKAKAVPRRLPARGTPVGLHNCPTLISVRTENLHFYPSFMHCTTRSYLLECASFPSSHNNTIPVDRS